MTPPMGARKGLPYIADAVSQENHPNEPRAPVKAVRH